MNVYKQLRKEKGLTQIELADKIHVTQASISKWEKDRVIPDISTLNIIANFFNVSVDYLLGRTELHEYKEKKELPAGDNTITVYGRGTGKKVYKVSPKRLKAIQALLDEDDQSDDIDF